jgi:putative transcriptional regulator
MAQIAGAPLDFYDGSRYGICGMTVQHHPSESSLLSFAAGSESVAASVVISTHLTFCSECRRSLAVFEAAGGLLLADEEDATMLEEALQLAFDGIGRPRAATPQFAENSTRRLPDGSAWPPVVQPYLGRPWRWLAPGMRRLRLLDQAHGGSLSVYRIAPGVGLPPHGHRGLELTCVLTGSFSDALGHYQPGDVSENDEAIEHQPVADAGPDCICLVASERPLKPRTTMSKLLQPILRF